MAFDVSTIGSYVKANETELIGKAVLKGKTAGIVGLQTGVKGSEKLNLLNTTTVLQTGACGWNASGSVAVTNRQITTAKLKVNEVYCEKDLIGTYVEAGVRAAAGQNVLPFEQQFIDQSIAGIQKQNEMNIWQGNAVLGTSGSYASSSYHAFDGLIHTLAAEATVVSTTITGSIGTSPITAVNAMVAAIPAEILDRDDLVLFVGQEIFMKYVAALVAANLYNYPAGGDNKTMSLTIPGYTVKLEGVAGLNSTNKAYLTYAANIRLGVDMEGDAEKFEFWYSQDNREFRLAVDYNLGVQVAFPDMIVAWAQE